MRVKTSDLSGKALNFAVSIIEGHRAEDLRRSFGDSLDIALRDDRGRLTGMVQTGHTYLSWLSPLGGAITERERIEILPMFNPEYWEARVAMRSAWFSGPTFLTAAMRCFVASKLGNEVDVPEEML